MTVRRSCAFLVVLIGLAQAAPAQAQFLKKLGYSIGLDTKRNNCWPEPFLMPDRQTVRAPIELMVEAGWKRQNLLSAHHFDEQTGNLTEAGELKVGWIVRQIPRQHRVVFVSRAETPEETAERIDAVQDAAIRMAGRENLPPVLESSLDPGGWPAGRVDAIDRKFEESIPDPKLPDYDPSAGGN